MTLNDLIPLGPLLVLKVRWQPPDFDRRMVGEMWLFPNGPRILELSTKCAPSEAFDVAFRARALLTAAGVDLSGKQETKTRTALEFFAKHRDGSATPSENVGGAQAPA